MKILQINSLKTGTGSATAASRLHYGFKKYGYQSKLITLDEHKGEILPVLKSKLARYLTRKNRKNEYEINIKSTKHISHTNGRINLNYYKKEIEASELLVIHWVFNGYINLNSLKNIDKPVILFMHDMWYFTGGCYVSENCENYKNNCIDCDAGVEQEIINQNILEKKEIYRKDKIYFFAPSEKHHQIARKSSLLKNKNIELCPNFIDIEKFSPKKKESSNKIKILYVAIGGPKNQYKGYDDFIKVLKLLNEENIKYEVNVVGWDISDEFKEIDIKFNSFGIVNNDDEMIKIYRSSSLLLFPSKAESYGQVVVEAMACGLPVVAYPVGVVSELVNNSNGYVSNEANPEDLVIGVKRVMENIEKFSKASRETILMKIDPLKIIQKYIEKI